MPLLRIESRSKTPPAADAPRRAEPRPAPGRSSGLPALAAGAVFALVLIAGFSAALVLSSRRAAPVGPAAQVPAQAEAGADLPPINADYPRDAVIATVNGQPFRMAELEVAVRIARTLGALSGDAVPAYGDPGMRAFQIKMLRRQIDILLMQQAVTREGLAVPGGPVDDLLAAFLQQVGATPERLAAEMAANGVSREQLEEWFTDSRTINTYVQQTMMAGHDQSEREAIVRAWLDREWASREILINFYDPGEVTE
jgi:hypothetical protein